MGISTAAALLATVAVAGPAAGPIAGPAAAADRESPRTVFRFDEAVTESSGLVDLGSRVLTVNDSGDDAVVYVVDPRTGRTVGRTTYADEVTDVEALAVGPDGDVWVGDIGDNGRSRAGITVHRIERPRDGDRRVTATTYDLAYRGGARDAEALLVSPRGRLYVVSKGLFSGQVWRAPEVLREKGVNVLEPVGDVGGLVTDGAWFPDGRHVVLRDYRAAHVYDATSTPWRQLAEIQLPDQRQGEGIAVRPGGSLLVSSEGKRQRVREVRLPSKLARVVAPSDSAATGGGDGAPLGDSGEGALGEFMDGGRDLRGTAAAVIVLLVLGLLVHRLVRPIARR